MTTGGWVAQISDEAAEYLTGLMNDHVPGKAGWCRCCRQLGCTKGDEARIGLAVAGRLEFPLPWAVRPEPGRWP